MTTTTTNQREKSNLTKLVVTAMLAAVAVVLQYLEFGVPLVPSFLKMDLSDIPELIGAFVIGPVGGVLIALVKNLIHLLVSQSGFVGELANFILGAVFAFTAGMIYKYRKTKKTALIACLNEQKITCLCMTPSSFISVVNAGVLEEGCLPGLKWGIMSGESMPWQPLALSHAPPSTGMTVVAPFSSAWQPSWFRARASEIGSESVRPSSRAASPGWGVIR